MASGGACGGVESAACKPGSWGVGRAGNSKRKISGGADSVGVGRAGGPCLRGGGL